SFSGSFLRRTAEQFSVREVFANPSSFSFSERRSFNIFGKTDIEVKFLEHLKELMDLNIRLVLKLLLIQPQGIRNWRLMRIPLGKLERRRNRRGRKLRRY
ncbi:hypothetical protein Tco_0486195, partial [Tanacetum coccineum]